MQGGLIGQRSGDHRLRLLAADLEAVEPGGPALPEDALDPDLVVLWRHCAPRGLSRCPSTLRRHRPVRRHPKVPRGVESSMTQGVASGWLLSGPGLLARPVRKAGR